MEQANGSRKLIKWRSSLALANYITILGITFQILKQSLLFQIMFIIFRCVQVRNPQLCDFRGKREKVTQSYTNTIYGKTLIKRMSKISGRSFYQLWFNLKHPAFNLPFPLNSTNSWQEQLNTTTWSFLNFAFLTMNPKINWKLWNREFT